MSRTRQDNPSPACPECGEQLVTNTLETHLRHKHQVYQFRGQRRSFNDTVVFLLYALCTPPADREAWQTLEAIIREQHGIRADHFLAAAVAATLNRFEAERRGPALTAAATAILAGRNSPGLLAMLADGDATARQLALLLASGSPTPLPDAQLGQMRLLLQDRRLPAGMQVAATAGLLRTLKGGPKREAELLEALVEGMGKVKAVERLRLLQELAGPRPVLVSMCDRIEARVRMRCPRCELELRRAEMVDHLWREHGLLLDGPRVREPWPTMEEWLRNARGNPDPKLLRRCRELAQELDAENGLARVHRLILRSGSRDTDSQRALLAEAEVKKASLCPACFALVPVPRPLPGRGLNRWRGRLSAHGYELEVSERGLRSRLEVVTPRETLYRGTEPGRRLTRLGATWLLAGPLVVLALAVAVGLPSPAVRPLLPVVLLLGGALVAALVAAVRWRPPAPLPDRAIDCAWERMAPRLHAGGFSLPDAEFLAGLALSSAGHGRPAARRPALTAALTLTERALRARPDAAGALAALRRLAVHDAVLEGKDPVPLVVAELGDCLEGRLPLAYGEALLTDWVSDWWTPGNLNRLRVLLCDRAFEAGFEVSHLLETGQSYAALGEALQVSNPRGLVLLRLLWSQRASQPWERASAAKTVFEWAEAPESAEGLRAFPDLLLIHENRAYAVAPENGEARPGPLEILVCGRGVALQRKLFERQPAELEVVSRGPYARGDHELRVGSKWFRFSSDPSDVAARLERWFRFLFNDFLPQTAAVMGWQSPDVGARLRARGAIPCPECSRPVLPRAGAIAKPLHD